MFETCEYIISAVSKKQYPNQNNLPEFVLLGRSNVGKSSLINALTNRKSLAKTSSKPGKTRTMNFFLIDKNFYLVDAPGYGYRKLGKKDDFDKMMDSYFSSNESLKLVVWLLDSRRELSLEDIDFYNFLSQINVPSLVVFTKADKLNQSEKAKITKIAQTQLPEFDYIFTSSLKKNNIELLRGKISSFIG